MQVFFLYGQPYDLEDKCLNGNGYSKVLVGFLSFSRAKINYCYACRIFSNEMQVNLDQLEVGQAIRSFHCKLV